VNVVKCKPDRLTDNNNNVARMDTSGPITINVPASLSGLAASVTAAAAD